MVRTEIESGRLDNSQVAKWMTWWTGNLELGHSTASIKIDALGMEYADYEKE